MASQIDIEGAIHYRHKAVPGQRLALHALKNEYGKPVVADGPMYDSYQGARFGEQVAALASSWKLTFADDPRFFYTVPDAAMAPKLTQPRIAGATGIPIDGWLVATARKGSAPAEGIAGFAGAVAEAAAR